MKQLPLLLVSLGALSLAASAQSLVRSVNGPAANSMYGKACIRIPDQNGDGYKDVLIGAPGFNSGRGAIYCLSGAYIAFGTGLQTLWSFAPNATPGDQFGYALADVGDATGDGISDFIVGQPGYDVMGSNEVGAIRVVDGAGHTAVSLIYGPTAGGALGTALAATGDLNGDGRPELAASAPGPNITTSAVYLVQGGFLNANGEITHVILGQIASSPEFGTSLASADFDGDGVRELVIGRPSGNGDVHVFACSTTLGLTSVGQYGSAISGERLGASLDAAHDYDGDGVIDIVVGAPNSPDAGGMKAGRVVVLSGARLLAQTPPYEIRTLLQGFSSQFFDFHFGAAVRACPDLNNDGVGDILVGAPDYTSVGAGGSILHKGLVSLFSGSSGSRLEAIAGNNGDILGDGLVGSIGDLDGDGFKEFVVAGSLSDAGGTDSGVVKCYHLFPIAPGIFCSGKQNSLGCTPAIGFSGTASASSSAPFLVTCSNQINQKTGLLFYSHAPTSISFQGGFLCVRSPIKRTLLQNSNGSASGSDCTGAFSLDFKARMQSGIDPTLVAGAEICCQYWSRDSGSPSATSLSNALRFVINP